jgi:uncharacterized membrane protein YhaH (DUF805 family)
MNPTLLKPIGRRTFFWGIVVLTVISGIIGFSGFFFGSPNQGSGAVQGMPIEMLPLSLLLGVISLLWDYKRIKDISSNPTYLFLLFIPAASQIAGVLLNDPSDSPLLIAPQVNAWDSPLMIGVTLLSFLNVVMFLFLLFKKGSPKSSPSPVSA